MKPFICTLILLISMINLSNSQVPNGDFNEWVKNGDYDEPAQWTSNNKLQFVSVTKVPSIIEGKYALQVSSKGMSFEGFAPGFVHTAFIPTKEYTQLKALIKINTIEKGNVEFIITQETDGEMKRIGYLKCENENSIPEEIVIPLNSSNKNEIKIEIKANSIMGNMGYEGFASLIIYNLEVSEGH